jgi:hypothetical protein
MKKSKKALENGDYKVYSDVSDLLKELEEKSEGPSEDSVQG